MNAHVLSNLLNELRKRCKMRGLQILSFKRSSHYEKGHKLRESLLDPVVSS